MIIEGYELELTKPRPFLRPKLQYYLKKGYVDVVRTPSENTDFFFKNWWIGISQSGKELCFGVYETTQD